jgi:hypothetical protein
VSAPLRRREEPDLRALAAACDMAVMRALELIGKRVVRGGERSRFGALNRSGRSWAEAHTIWRPEPGQVDAALSGAWTVLPRLVAEHGCCALVEPGLQSLLDGYVRELALSGREHTFEELQQRLRAAAGA